MSVLAWYAEAEPQLLVLQKRLQSGKLDPADARAELSRLVGLGVKTAQWKAASEHLPTPRGRDRGLFELECFERMFPLDHLGHRITGVGTFDICAKELGIAVELPAQRPAEPKKAKR